MAAHSDMATARNNREVFEPKSGVSETLLGQLKCVTPICDMRAPWGAFVVDFVFLKVGQLWGSTQ